MAKKNLDALVVQLGQRVEKTSKYRSIVDTYEHVYIVSKKKLVNQLYTQISGYYVKDKDSVKFLSFKRDVLTGSQDPELRKKLEDLLSEYIDNLRKRAEGYRSSGIITGSYADGILYGNKFVSGTSRSLPDGGFVSVIRGNNKISVFGALSSIRKITTSTITRLLPQLRQDVYDTLVQSEYFKRIMSASSNADHISNTLKYRTIGISGTSSSGRDWYKGGLFEGGHQSGYSVVEQELRDKFILENDNQISLQEVLKGLPTQILELGSLRAIVEKNTLYRKQVAIVFEQGEQYNNLQSTKERKLRDLLSKEIGKTVNSLSAEFWADFETSSSIRTNIAHEIMKEATKSGAKVYTKAKLKNVNAKPKSKPVKIVGKLDRSSSESVLPNNTTKGKIDVKNNKGKVPTNNKPSWLQLLPIINAKLPDTVAKNMKSPRLNFRTGRFAQSAQVVNVEQTTQGFPSFVFDYERDPYDVFDRTLGRAPWNTPQRDPRALVDMSVREIVREMAIGRFFTRRA